MYQRWQEMRFDRNWYETDAGSWQSIVYTGFQFIDEVLHTFDGILGIFDWRGEFCQWAHRHDGGYHELLIACEEMTSFVKRFGQVRLASFLARNDDYSDDGVDYEVEWREHIASGFSKPYDQCIAAIEKARGNDKETN